jgi:hypothetical protein
MTSTTEPTADPQLVDNVLALAEREGAGWFPMLDGPGLTAQLVGFASRPRCFLYRFALSQGAKRREFMVKVRHSDPELRRVDRYSDRPELTPQRTLPDVEAARHEFAGLQLIAKALRDTDGADFGVLRGLAELPEWAAIVMEYVDQPTLRQLVAGSWRRRLTFGRLSRLEEGTWPRLGEWLRRFHAADAGDALAERMTNRDDLVLQLERSREFLARAGGDASMVPQLVRAAAKAAVDVFDLELPSAVGHGDFTAQNVFVDQSGRLTVFDPLPIWRVCVYEDLARLTMGVRLLGPQVVSGGRLLHGAQLDNWESKVVSAYSPGSDGAARLRVYQTVLLLDRWGELVSKRPVKGRVRGGARTARVHVASRWFRQEAARLSGALA